MGGVWCGWVCVMVHGEMPLCKAINWELCDRINIGRRGFLSGATPEVRPTVGSACTSIYYGVPLWIAYWLYVVVAIDRFSG